MTALTWFPAQPSPTRTIRVEAAAAGPAPTANAKNNASSRTPLITLPPRVVVSSRGSLIPSARGPHHATSPKRVARLRRAPALHGGSRSGSATTREGRAARRTDDGAQGAARLTRRRQDFQS